MGGVVTADFIIGSRDDLTRHDLDQIIKILDIRDPVTGKLVQPPVGQDCTYKLVLEKSDQPVPAGSAAAHASHKKPGK